MTTQLSNYTHDELDHKLVTLSHSRSMNDPELDALFQERERRAHDYRQLLTTAEYTLCGIADDWAVEYDPQAGTAKVTVQHRGREGVFHNSPTIHSTLKAFLSARDPNRIVRVKITEAHHNYLDDELVRLRESGILMESVILRRTFIEGPAHALKYIADGISCCQEDESLEFEVMSNTSMGTQAQLDVRVAFGVAQKKASLRELLRKLNRA